MKFTALMLITLLFTSCSMVPRREGNLAQIRKQSVIERAEIEMSCNEKKLTVTPHKKSPSIFVAEGCGKKAFYSAKCSYLYGDESYFVLTFNIFIETQYDCTADFIKYAKK